MKTLVTSLAFAFVLATAVRADETYDLKLKYTPKVGDKTNHTSKEKMAMKMTVSSGGAVVQEQDQKEKKSFQYTEEVVKVAGDDVSEGKYTFQEATHEVEGEDTDYAFKGKTVLGKKGEDGWEFTYEDGSELAEEDVAGVKDALSKKKNKKEGEPGVEEALSPGKPVKVGESWDLDPKKFASGMMDDEESFDLEKSKGSMTLISVEKRGGAQFGKIEGEIELVAEKMGPVQLNKPLKLKFKLTLDVCIDATEPTGTMKIDAGMKGKRTAEANGQEFELDIDMDMGGTLTIERAK
ncbi:MAG: hypothetical protein HYY18_13675 [Planctomycetes bacterium]|nr:hypothetical protein [Planctomycetota bacterium]